jgi:serine/threonine protein kinase
MADLRSALVALSQGRLGFHILAETLERHISQSPQLKGPLFRQLATAYEDGIIDAHTYQKLRYQISDRSYANPADIAPTDDDPTSILPGRPAFTPSFPGPNGSDSEDDTALDLQPPAPASRSRLLRADTAGDSTGDITKPELSGKSQFAPSEPSSGSQPSRPRTPTQSRLRPGSVIKERFILDEVLGVGGMGTVYKGRDLLKVEARDRDPYLALKVLNEDFKKHPDSFIALQREASRQQRLAHPNIATVYDFDRTGSTVFITMELLEGTPLNQFIRQEVKPRGGLSPDEALPMIEGLSNALIYAHERQIVHSDFKPGNCFLTKNKTMKVLDFGIARAVKNPGQGDGEKTLFDPRKLGALTPAYASAEMLDGQHPDPRDDIYALACVSYELLTGRHPFNKLSAKKAKENNLGPLPIKTLSRRQNQALAKGLAFERDKRHQNVADFLEDLSGRHHPIKNALVIGAIIGVFIAVLAIGPVSNYVEKNHLQTLIDDLRGGGEKDINRVLKALPALDQSEQQLVIREGRETIIHYFESKIADKLDPYDVQFDYAGAERLLAEARYLYPDSASLQAVIRQVEDGRNQLINDFTASFNRHLQDGRLLEDPHGEDIVDALQLIREVDPENPLLEDPRLADAYAKLAQQAHEAKNFDRAESLITTGLRLAPNAPQLVDLRDLVAASRIEAKRLAQANSIEQSMAAAIDTFNELDDFAARQDDIRILTTYKRSSRVLSALAERARDSFARHINQLSKERDWGAEAKLITDYGELITAFGLQDELQRFRQAAIDYEQRISALLDEIKQAIAERRLGPPATPNAVDLLAALEDAAPGHPRTAQARFQLSQAFLNDARRARVADRWDKARIQVAMARDLETEGLLADAIETEIAAIANAELEAKLRTPSEEQQRRAVERSERIATLLEKFQIQLDELNLAREDVARAIATLDEVASLDPNNSRAEDGRAQLADKLAQQLTNRADDENLEDTLSLAESFADVLPDSAVLQRAVAQLSERSLALAERERRELLASERESLASLLQRSQLDESWNRAIDDALSSLSLQLGENAPELEELRIAVADRLLQESRTMRTAQRFSEARSLLQRATAYAPDYSQIDQDRIALANEEAAFVSSQEVALEQARLDNLKRSLLAQARAKRVSEAAASLEALSSALPEGDPFITVEAPEAIADAYHRLAVDSAQAGDYDDAMNYAQTGLKFAPGMASLQQALRAYSLEGGIARLKRSVSNSTSLNIGDIRRQLDTIKSVDVARYNAIRKEFINILVSRINSLHQAGDPTSITLLEQAKELFPESAELQDLDLQSTPLARADAIANQPAATVRTAGRGRPCLAELAGHGQRARGTCYDMLGEHPGPALVVVPGSDLGAPYAIGKYEVTLGEYNDYCRASGRCQARNDGDPGSPVRGISAEQAQDYAAWLSEMTGSRYRLPTVSEWRHAASAEGDVSRRDINCRVTQGNNVLKGQSVLDVHTGSSNRWGLVNHVGNVQELVRDGSGLRAIGGSYADPLSNCDITLQKPINAQSGDELTGFRLLRELG